MTSTADHLAIIDLLRARDFPDRRGVVGAVASGPGFHVADLRVSEDFWDADLERLIEVEEEFEVELGVLVQVLSLRWGEPEVLDLADHLERDAMGERVPEPLRSLCGYVGRVYGWRTDGRWIGLGIGQGDRELPLQLVAAIGEDNVR
ncbi:hypothetical protein B7755_005770 [Streptomyces sp. NBS 14/10]|uniref:hypothetical protein n=1 Tax=Streptomyces sp. NBS 14/10 TaxID=1945643 RepID=UPI000B7EFB82|nr:hypothetical protein [Streptomyces sp. NBS 14/10]KAK1177721.1 hypothetical protein B7755_005770 [Streptomyces sp. NBS 14/10]